MSDKEKQENLLAMRAMNEFNLDDDDTSRFDYCFLVLSTLKEETSHFSLPAKFMQQLSRMRHGEFRVINFRD